MGVNREKHGGTGGAFHSLDKNVPTKVFLLQDKIRREAGFLNALRQRRAEFVGSRHKDRVPQGGEGRGQAKGVVNAQDVHLLVSAVLEMTVSVRGPREGMPKKHLGIPMTPGTAVDGEYIHKALLCSHVFVH
jgi:hypothetical protein